ncbi:DinB family protein [Emticicia sp. BO119]|uniref:DinB family protein n=1 Tax=Emticicia sp. BO119 TaxID=2757768 RepID=UPI0015F07BA5|nr:DinB family protein [Emticicia sp. BO119]MBA4849709.1 DinB family protein [Emticicia sp. BO119]
MKAYFHKLFEHEHWANIEVLETFLEATEVSDRAHEIISHMVAAQTIWIERINGTPSDTKVWSVYEKVALQGLFDANYEALQTLIDREDFNRVVTYINSRGAQYSSTVSDILTHMALHASYHRGQIILLIKGQVEKLPATDYIFYYR